MANGLRRISDAQAVTRTHHRKGGRDDPAIDIGEEAVAIVTDAMPTYRAAAAESGLDGS
jgi:hypothetical protein